MIDPEYIEQEIRELRGLLDANRARWNTALAGINAKLDQFNRQADQEYEVANVVMPFGQQHSRLGQKLDSYLTEFGVLEEQARGLTSQLMTLHRILSKWRDKHGPE